MEFMQGGTLGQAAKAATLTEQHIAYIALEVNYHLHLSSLVSSFHLSLSLL